MKNKIILLSLISSLLISNISLAKNFTDVSSTHPNYIAIKYLNEKGIIEGYPDETFAPAKLVNRAEALKIILIGTKFKIDETLKTENLFKDVKGNEWFAKILANAKNKNIISGNPDGTFMPGKSISRAEFIKILLINSNFKPEAWQGKEEYPDIPKDAWFNPYMNYAGKSGLITKDSNSKLLPGKELSRGEVAEIFYIMSIILNGKDTQFLIDQSEAQMSQIELYIASSDIKNAKRSSELAVDLTQQAYRNLPENNIVLGAAKIAKAYDALVDAFILALQKDTAKATEMANLVIKKADEAWQANNETQPIARHLKDRAKEILTQISNTKS